MNSTPATSPQLSSTTLTLPITLTAEDAPRAARLLEVRAWARLRTVVGLVMLVLAASLTVFGSETLRVHAGDVALGLCFPLLAIAVIHRRRAPEDSLTGSLLDVTANALSAVSLSAMLMLGIDALLGAPHQAELAIRL